MSDNEEITYEREVLYGQAWAEPVRDVAKRYGVSGVALAKTCRRLSVPVPGRGYWAKKQAGCAPARPPLPPHRGPSSVTVDRRQQEALAKEEALRAAAQIPEVHVAAALRNPHPLVAAAREVLTEKARDGGLAWARWSGCLDITVSRNQLGRALRIADAVVKALEKDGIGVQIGPEKRGFYGDLDRHDSYETQALCKGETVTFALVEKQRMERHEPDPKDKARGWLWDRPTTTYHPSSKLELRLTNYRLSGMRKTWGDGKRQRLEDCLGSFVAHVPVAADQLAELRALAERRERAWREAEERRQAERRRREEEERRSVALLARVTRWRQADDIASYVAAASKRLDESDLPPEELQRHRRDLQWALDYAERISPLTNIETLEPLLNDDVHADS